LVHWNSKGNEGDALIKKDYERVEDIFAHVAPIDGEDTVSSTEDGANVLEFLVTSNSFDKVFHK